MVRPDAAVGRALNCGWLGSQLRFVGLSTAVLRGSQRMKLSSFSYRFLAFAMSSRPSAGTRLYRGLSRARDARMAVSTSFWSLSLDFVILDNRRKICSYLFSTLRHVFFPSCAPVWHAPLGEYMYLDADWCLDPRCLYIFRILQGRRLLRRACRPSLLRAETVSL